MSEIRILALGDAVGSSGVGYLADNRCLAKAIRSLGAHFTVVNAENSADGNGILPQSAEELFDAGADILTGAITPSAAAKYITCSTTAKIFSARRICPPRRRVTDGRCTMRRGYGYLS